MNKDNKIKNVNVNTEQKVEEDKVINTVLSLIENRNLIIGNDLHCYFISFEGKLENVETLIKEAFEDLQKQAKKMGGNCIELNSEPIDYGLFKRVQIQFDENCDEATLWEIFDKVSAEEMNFFLNVMKDDDDEDSYLDETYYESGDND